MKSAGNEFTIGRGFLEALRGEANEITEMLTLAVAVADQGCRFDIEYGSTPVVIESGEWLDISAPSSDVCAMPTEARERFQTQVARALRYLDLRGQLVRHPTFETLFRFEEERLH
jgi:hypothetical protein